MNYHLFLDLLAWTKRRKKKGRFVEKGSCKTCRYFDGLVDGQCKRHAPIAHPNAPNESNYTHTNPVPQWPKVSWGIWCGEYVEETPEP